jgi:hypothetical protein
MHDDNPGLWVTTKDIQERQRQEAAALAESRADYYVSAPGRDGLQGPMGERQMRQMVGRLLDVGRKPVVLRAVEVYE